jgi:antirestriction protein
MEREIDNMQDIIDLRDVIARVEELEEERERCTLTAPDGTETENSEGWAEVFPEEAAELAMLNTLLEECKGNGGDEQWRGDWYSVTLIRDSYFETYAQELADDIGAINSDARWPNNCIDWERAARELQMDYTSVDFFGIDYWTR